MTVTLGQLRAARGLLGWSQEMLAEKSGVGRATIADFEAGKRTPYDRTITTLRAALKSAGVEFTNGGQPGVRMKIYADPAQPATLTYSGHSVPCFTLGEAVIAWAHLSPSQQNGAIIKAADGREFGRNEIDLLYRPPK